jgi:hypothetical protein
MGTKQYVLIPLLYISENIKIIECYFNPPRFANGGQHPFVFNIFLAADTLN